MDQLADTLRERFRRYMKPGSDVAIDECIEGFEGRAKEAVNIPSKPTPIGFKQWVLASDGYVFDWLWHARGSGKRDGPQDLDRTWIDEGFSATQAVVLATTHDLVLPSARLPLFVSFVCFLRLSCLSPLALGSSDPSAHTYISAPFPFPSSASFLFLFV